MEKRPGSFCSRSVAVFSLCRAALSLLPQSSRGTTLLVQTGMFFSETNLARDRPRAPAAQARGPTGAGLELDGLGSGGVGPAPEWQYQIPPPGLRVSCWFLLLGSRVLQSWPLVKADSSGVHQPRPLCLGKSGLVSTGATTEHRQLPTPTGPPSRQEVRREAENTLSPGY